MRRILLTFFILFLSVSNGHAMELTLEECITQALENNRNLKTFEMDVLASEEDIKTSRTKFLPLLHLKGNYTMLDKSDVIIFNSNLFAPGIPPEDIESSLKNRDMYGLSLSIEQPLFTGGYLTHSFMKSRILNEEARYGIERQKNLLVFEVKKAFHEALKEQLYKGILEKIIESKKEKLRVLKERHKEGYTSLEDVLILENELTGSELELYKAKNKGDFALSKLKRLMYHKNDELTLKGEPINGFLTASLQELEESALRNREDLKLSLARMKAAAEDIGIAKSEFYPKASLEGRYMLQKETNITRPEVWMLTGMINWALFEWGRTKSEVKKAEAVRQKLRYEYEELERMIMLEAEFAWRSCKENEKEIEIKEKRLKTAEYRFKQAIDRYTEGIIKMADLFEMEAELIKAYNEYIIAISDLDISLAHLEASTSTTEERWFSICDIYRPDFDSISKTLKELISKNNKNELEERHNEAKHSANMSDSDRLTKSPEDRFAEIKEEKVLSNPTIVVQVAAFKTKHNAEKLMKNLLKKITDKKIIIHHKKGHYKVRITGFKDKAEAEDIIRNSGIKDYLIIRVHNGH